MLLIDRLQSILLLYKRSAAIRSMYIHLSGAGATGGLHLDTAAFGGVLRSGRDISGKPLVRPPLRW